MYGVDRKCEEMLVFYSKWPKLAYFFNLKLLEFDNSDSDFSADFQRTNRFVFMGLYCTKFMCLHIPISLAPALVLK